MVRRLGLGHLANNFAAVRQKRKRHHDAYYIHDLGEQSSIAVWVASLETLSSSRIMRLFLRTVVSQWGPCGLSSSIRSSPIRINWGDGITTLLKTYLFRRLILIRKQSIWIALGGGHGQVWLNNEFFII